MDTLENTMAIGAEIAAVRHKLGLSQTALGRMVGCSASSIGKIERGIGNAYFTAVMRVIDGYANRFRYPLLFEMLKQLPPDGRWTQAERDRWWTAFVAILDMYIKVVDKPG